MQYRMCADVMALANELTYAGQLRCGSSLVEHGMLSLTSAIPESLPGWLRQASAHMHTPHPESQSFHMSSLPYSPKTPGRALELL